MLLLWSAGIAVAAALLCYAFVAGESITLFVCGAVFAGVGVDRPGRLAGALAAGAGSSNPVSRRWKPWLAVTFVLLVLATGLGGLARGRAGRRGRRARTVR